MKISALRAGLAVLLSLSSSVVLAHPGHASAIADGILHPLTGLDHLLAMAGIGLWSARQTGHARWLIPGSFLALTAIGAWLGTVGHTPTFTEQGIAASVFLIGLLISFPVRFPANISALAGMLIAGVFALFHGFAHGTEIPDSAGAWQFASGFILTTITLQAIGFFVGRTLTKNEKLLRIGGAAIAASGGLLAFQGLH